MQTILGGGGAIGTELARELARYTSRVRIVGRNPKRVNPTDELLTADLSDPSQVDAAVAGSEVVYLTVGFEYDRAVWRRLWPPLMQATLAACATHGAKLVFFDNVYLYDPQKVGHMTEETPIGPRSEKGQVRAEVAGLLMEAVAAGRVQALIARAADFYGPGNDKSVVQETVLKNLQKGKPADWFGSLNKEHNFTYTPDAARATALLGNTPDAYGQVWHLPTAPTRRTGRDWVQLFAQELGVQPRQRALPVWAMAMLGWFVPIMKEFREMAYQYDHDYFFDSLKFERRFGVKATPPEVAVREIVAHG